MVDIPHSVQHIPPHHHHPSTTHPNSSHCSDNVNLTRWSGNLQTANVLCERENRDTQCSDTSGNSQGLPPKHSKRSCTCSNLLLVFSTTGCLKAINRMFLTQMFIVH